VDQLVDDGNGNIVDEGSIQARGQALTGGYGLRLGSLDLGAAARWVADDPDGQGFAHAFSADVGLSWRAWQGLRLGASFNQLGGSLFGQALPAHGRLSLGYARPLSEKLSSSLGVEQRVPTLDASDASTHFGLGLGWTQSLWLRGGYEWLQSVGVGYWRAGVGVVLAGYRVDYAFAAGEEGGDAHLVSLGIDWAQVFGKRAAAAAQTSAPADAAAGSLAPVEQRLEMQEP
jgi:hypothetical protein